MAYSEKEIETLFDKICELIAEGASLSSVLKNENMPSRPLFYQWLKEDETKINRYARATELRAELIFEDIMNIADAVDSDVIEQPDGTLATNHNVINRDRLRIDTRKWALSKMMPKKYGDSIKLEHDGEIKISELTPEERETRIIELAAKLKPKLDDNR